MSFLCITLGPALLFLYAFENTKNRISDFFLVYGRVPFFYYFLHMIVIHSLALLVLVLIKGDWRQMIFNAEHVMSGRMADYGYSLLTVYIIWVSVIAVLYIPCRAYMRYKAKNKEKWWLSYL